MRARVPRPAVAMWHYLKSLHDLYGWVRIKVSTLMKKYKRSEATIHRWLGALRAVDALSSEQHGRTCCSYTIKPLLIGESDRPEAQQSLYELPRSVSPTEKQNHPEDAEPVAEIARKSAGFERLSEGDRRFVADLQRQGATPEDIRAGILVGRARRLVAESQWAANAAERGGAFKFDPGPIRSLRYFAGTIAEKFEPGYVEHVDGWLRRRA